MDTQDNNNTENEVWKDIPGYEGDYQVSNQGRVKSFKRYGGEIERILRPLDRGHGYLHVNLHCNKKRKGVTIHSLVMLAFTGERPDGMDINHIDGVKTNNHLDNLEYCTRAENTQHAFDTGLQVSLSGEENGYSKLTRKQVLEIRARYKAGGISQEKIGQEYGVSHPTISNIVNRKAWKHI